MKYRYAFIGAGNMGSAMLSGVLSAGLVSKDNVIVSCKSAETKKRIKERFFGITVVSDNGEAAKDAEIIILAVKPHQFDDVLPDIREVLHPEQIIVSIAAGKSISDIETACQSMAVAGKLMVARAMPNTPAAVGEAMSAVCFNDRFSDEARQAVLDIFSSFGRAEEVSESMMDVVTGVSGSSPAYIYMLIEAMADEAVLHGMTRDKAYVFAAQAVLGSAKMVLKSGKHPGLLKDEVCSPGGTTIEGVAALEQSGFRAAVMEGISVAIEKSELMSR